jgi:cobalt-precorrin-5B (C1)-methyltransferase
MNKVKRTDKPDTTDGLPLRRGWTTGACATAATSAALSALLTGEFPDPVMITLPKGETPAFALAMEKLQASEASAGIIKDAGDDPDVTHGALIIATVRRLPKGSGLNISGGKGVGRVTKPGLPVGVGEPAINPVPRTMITNVVTTLCATHNIPADFEVEISVPDGEKLAERTWNPRLGILGGISILGTTGIVHPFSCSAWIHSIMRGIDVCRANGISHAIGATGSTSETAAQTIYGLPPEALLDMGDFAGGLLKYLRTHPIENLTLAGGFAKFTKLAEGSLDLHSGRSQVNLDWLAAEAIGLGLGKADGEKIASANTALEALEIAGEQIPLAAHIAELARQTCQRTLRNASVNVEVMIFSRQGDLLARVGRLNV